MKTAVQRLLRTAREGVCFAATVVVSLSFGDEEKKKKGKESFEIPGANQTTLCPHSPSSYCFDLPSVLRELIITTMSVKE